MTPPRSDHFNGKTYFYPGAPAGRSLADVLRWKLTSRAARWPGRVEVATPPVPPPSPRPGEIVATWIGHSTFLLQTTHGNFLTDPVFSERASPLAWVGPRRVHPPGLPFEALPRIDAVLLSHDHYDHCDLPSLRRLAQTHAPLVIAPLGHRALLLRAGFPAARIVELDWWQTHPFTPDVAVMLTPSRHWGRRAPGDTNTRLWGGFFLTFHAASAPLTRRLYFLGDSGYDENLFRDIGQRAGAPDLALIPIGAYEPRWFMRDAHMNPAEAVRAHRDLGARRSVAMHWGTFQLTDEARDTPVHDLAAARTAAGVSAESFATLQPGESLVV